MGRGGLKGGRPHLVVKVGQEAQELPPLVGEQVPALRGHHIVHHVLAGGCAGGRGRAGSCGRGAGRADGALALVEEGLLNRLVLVLLVLVQLVAQLTLDLGVLLLLLLAAEVQEGAHSVELQPQEATLSNWHRHKAHFHMWS